MPTRNSFADFGVRYLLPILIAGMLSGCAAKLNGEKLFVVEAGDLQQGDPLGTSLVLKKGYTYDRVWKAAMVAMSKDMNIVESHKPSGVIKSKMGNKMVGFWITPTSPTANAYTVETLRVQPLGFNGVGATDAKGWEPAVLENFGVALGTP